MSVLRHYSVNGRWVDEREYAAYASDALMALQDERDELAAKVARVREIVACMCGHPTGGGCVEATYREAFRAALGDTP